MTPIIGARGAHVLLLRRRKRRVRADQSSAAQGRCVSPARRRQRAVIPELDCRANRPPKLIAAVMPMNTLGQARHLNSSASAPIRKVITPYRITIALFTSVMRAIFWLGRRSALHQISTEAQSCSGGLLAAFFALLNYLKDHPISFF